MKNKAIDKKIEKIVRKVSIERSKIIAEQIKGLELVEKRTKMVVYFRSD